MKNKYIKLLAVMAGSALILTLFCGCAQKDITSSGLALHTYGFWSGLLHGFIAPFDFIGMVLTDHIVMYAPNNNGAWYAFGFLLGSGGWGFLSSNGKRLRRRPRQDYGSAEVL